MAISVQARFLSKDVTGNARNGEYLVPDPCTVGEFMNIAAAENGSFVENYMDFVLFMVNGRSADADTVLHDSDQIKVLAFVYGG